MSSGDSKWTSKRGCAGQRSGPSVPEGTEREFQAGENGFVLGGTGELGAGSTGSKIVTQGLEREERILEKELSYSHRTDG